MPRPEKVQAVEEIKGRMEDARAFFLTEYRGLSVKQQQTLRRALREAGADYKVLKMTLAAIAARELGHDEIAEELVGPTAIAFADEDAVAAAKALDEFATGNEAFVLKAGMLSGNLLAPEQVSELAKMPSRDELLGKIAGAMAAPMFGAAGLFAAFTRNAASMFSQLLEKKEADGPADAAPAEEPEAPVEEAAADTPADDTPEATDAEAEAASDADADGEVAEADAETPDEEPTPEAPEASDDAEADPAPSDEDAEDAADEAADDDSEEE
jgi:large subunit ribosomal protein L10